jgi:hypothetical protein
MRIRAGWVVAVLALAAGSCVGSSEPSTQATVVLFDVSNSTQPESVRARYEDTFGMVLAHLQADGGVLGADIIDANPMVHGALPINETFEPCTVMDNSLDCRRGHEQQERSVTDQAGRILEHSSRGTDILGAFALAEQFFDAYPDAQVRTLVVLSDMVQSAHGMHLGAVEEWSEARTSELLDETSRVDLDGVRVYVVGAGATALARMTPIQIRGIQRFWTRWFEEAGASVEFYGANLARFPIEEAQG